LTPEFLIGERSILDALSIGEKSETEQRLGCLASDAVDAKRFQYGRRLRRQ
jgi:hypothetical protein